LPHVSHYYYGAAPLLAARRGGHRREKFCAEAALDLYRAGARVTLVHRRAELGSTIKYWVRPDIENRIKAGQVRALFETEVKAHRTWRRLGIESCGEYCLPAFRYLR